MLIMVLACSDALPVAKDLQPMCVKVDECSCNLVNVEQPGLIDLHGIIDGQGPAFETTGKSEQTGLEYNFYYNPCLNFSDFGCPGTGLCQTGDRVQAYDLGNLDTAEFKVVDNSVVVVYKSKFSDSFGYNRSSEVELVCDETELKGKFEYIAEPIERNYKFLLYTQCACPGKCAPKCVTKDLCSCEMSDGSGTINLHSLDNPTNPMSDEPKPGQTFFYNPCSSIINPSCGPHSVCEKQGDTTLGLGITDTAQFTSNNTLLSIQYLTSFGTGRVSTVNLICDESQREESFFRVNDDMETFNLYSVCACPDGCSTPPTPASCDQTDSCTCKSTSDDTVITLHDLDNPYAPLTAVDSEGYTYYYNPCSGIKLENPIGKCNGVAACQQDPFHDTYYNIGNTGPKIDYNVTSKSFTFHYTGGEGGRSFDVQMLCDPDSDDPTLAANGDIPKGVIAYPLTLTSKYVCAKQLLE